MVRLEIVRFYLGLMLACCLTVGCSGSLDKPDNNDARIEAPDGGHGKVGIDDDGGVFAVDPSGSDLAVYFPDLPTFKIDPTGAASWSSRRPKFFQRIEYERGVYQRFLAACIDGMKAHSGEELPKDFERVTERMSIHFGAESASYGLNLVFRRFADEPWPDEIVRLHDAIKILYATLDRSQEAPARKDP